MLTGSGSKGNGGVYYYYHCQNGCSEHIRASDVNDAIVEYLNTFKAHPQINELYLKIMEDIFNTKEGDREKQLVTIDSKIKDIHQKLLKIDEMFVNEDLEKDLYSRLKNLHKKKRQNLSKATPN